MKKLKPLALSATLCAALLSSALSPAIAGPDNFYQSKEVTAQNVEFNNR